MNREPGKELGPGRGQYPSIELSNAVRLTHERVLAPFIEFRLIAVKPVALDWCEKGVTICRWHDSVEWIAPTREFYTYPRARSHFSLCRTPDEIKNALAFRLRL